MRKFFAVLLCLAVITASVAVFTSCDNDENNIREVDMSLRSDTLYGLYWYGDSGELDDMKISQENMPTEYYDPSKPTVIYSHGWKAVGINGVQEEKEKLATLSKTYAATNGASGNRNYVSELKELGYNVAFWDWHAYAQDLANLHNEIWVVKDAQALSEKEGNYYEALLALDGRTFAGELVRSMCAVMKDASDQEVVFIGHSFGGQMVTAAAYTLYKLAEEGIISNKNILPNRISLADPYMTGATMKGQMDLLTENLSSMPAAEKAADAFEYLNQNGATIDFNGAMTGMTYNAYAGITGVKDKELQAAITAKIKANTVYVLQSCLTSEYGSIGDVHNVSRDFVISTFIEGKDGNLPASMTPNVSMTADQLKAYVGKEYDEIGTGFDFATIQMQKILSE